MEQSAKLTMTVPEAGELLGVSRNAAYAAAAAGQIPTIRIGKRLLVPTAALRRLLDSAVPKHEDAA
jgi:excisionase family DNA binding protein